MENVKLEIGKCAICGGPIDEEWAGKNPILGTKCRTCSHKRPEHQVFGVKNIDFNVEKTLIFNPLMGEYEYHLDFKGSQIMVNDKIGTIRSVQGDAAWVKFSDDEKLLDSEPIHDLGYWDLLRIYKEAGFDKNPPPLALPDCPKEKVILLDVPIIPLIINGQNTSKGPVVNAIYIGDEFGHKAMKIPFIETLHAFANLYTRYKLGLAPNYCFEGGFIGKGFEIRNMTGAVGITINMDQMGLEQIENWEDFESALKGQLLINRIYEQEQERPGVAKKDATIYETLSVWLGIMGTLLRYDWNKEKMETIDDVWHGYCTMQNVLRNIIAEDEIKKSFAYCRDHKLVHYGKSY